MYPFKHGMSDLPQEIRSCLMVLKNELMKISCAHTVVLFGSYSKGTYNKDSDIDIAVFVGENDSEKIHGIFLQAQRIAVRVMPCYDVQIMVFPEDMLDSPQGIIEEIVLYGCDIT